MSAAASSVPLHRCSARQLVAAIRARSVSATEAVTAALARIDARNHELNAIVTLAPEQALATAAKADRAASRGESLGALHGLPIAVKDLQDTAGMRTTYGSPIYAEHVPSADSPLVALLRGAGAIVVGKTNTSEFGAGSQTFNSVFGATRNPFDRELCAGGSSGGAAAAVASGMLPLADGTDLAASVRNPAAFCGVAGLRPTPGRLPAADPADIWEGLSVPGPIAREVGDLALMLAIAPGAPQPIAPRPAHGLRIAWSSDGGGLPIDPALGAALGLAREELERSGCAVEEVELDLDGADDAFDVLRALRFARRLGPLLERERARIKETVVWNTERGLALTGAEVARAQAERARLFAAMRSLLERFDLLALPATQVLPFPVEQPWPGAGPGEEDPSTYLDWVRVCSRITVTAHPAVSMPAGCSEHGLPVGLQLVGSFGGDEQLLACAAAVETALRPITRLIRQPLREGGRS